MNKRPELDTKNPPGQVVNDWTEQVPPWRPPKYLRDVIIAAQVRSSEDPTTLLPTHAEKRLQALVGALAALREEYKQCGTGGDFTTEDAVRALTKILEENT